MVHPFSCPFSGPAKDAAALRDFPQGRCGAQGGQKGGQTQRESLQHHQGGGVHHAGQELPTDPPSAQGCPAQQIQGLCGGCGWQ